MKKTLLILPLLLLTLSIVGCKDDDDNLLVGTKWKLAGFVDSQTNTTREPQPSDCVECYLLLFDTNSTFSGHSLTNTLWGSYDTNSSSTIRFTEIGGTKINELYNGEEFVSSLSNVASFTFSKEELKLFYNDNLYLLFNPY